jgi:hypothetical protein
MFLGHFGLAFAAKKAAPKASLGILVFAAQFADLLWPLLLLLGIERVRIVPDAPPALQFEFTSYPISHSLVALLGWGACRRDLFCNPARFPQRIGRGSIGAKPLGARLHRTLSGHAHLSRWPEIRARHVEFRSFDDFSGVFAFCGRRCAVHQRDSCERYNGKMGGLVAGRPTCNSLSSLVVGSPASQRAGARMERAGHMAYGAMGGVGRPASAMRPAGNAIAA